MFKLVFEVSGLPKMTNPSGRKSTHWRKLKEETDTWKFGIARICSSKRPAVPLKKAQLTLTRFSSVCPDSDGLVSGFKAVIDGLVYGAILENDKFKNIGMPIYKWESAPQKAGKIRIEVEER